MAKLNWLACLPDGLLLYMLAQTGSDLGYESLALKITTGRWLFSFTQTVHSAGDLGTSITGFSRHRLPVVPTAQQSLSARPIHRDSGCGFKQELELTTTTQ
jgi:hypothetical protein